MPIYVWLDHLPVEVTYEVGVPPVEKKILMDGLVCICTDPTILNSPSQFEDPEPLSDDWFKPARAYASDDSWAEARKRIGAVLTSWRNYGFDTAIPDGATITAVKIKPEHHEGDNASWLWLDVSVDGGITWLNITNQPQQHVGAQDYIDEVDITNETSWTKNKLSNANFRVKAIGQHGIV